MTTREGNNQTLSVVIPTFNCAEKLHRCLASVRWADEIIVIDMGSTDNTLTIAKKFGAKTYCRIPKDNNFDKNRLWGMQKAKSDWILKIDSDELLSPALQEEIKKFMKSRDGKEFYGYNLYNRLFWFGKQIKHGCAKPKSHELRLVRNGKWHYNPYRYHQLITVDGRVGFLKNSYDHDNYDSVHEFIEKTNKYTSLDSRLYLATRLNALKMVVFPIGTFLKLYFWQKGFIDRKIGLISSFLFSIYNLIEKIKIWEYQNILS